MNPDTPLREAQSTIVAQSKRPIAVLEQLLLDRASLPPVVDIDRLSGPEDTLFTVRIELTIDGRSIVLDMPPTLGLEHAQQRAAAHVLARLDERAAAEVQPWLRPLPDHEATSKVRALCRILKIAPPSVHVTRGKPAGVYIATLSVSYTERITATEAYPHHELAQCAAAETLMAAIRRADPVRLEAMERQAARPACPEYRPPRWHDQVNPNECHWVRDITKATRKALRIVGERYSVRQHRTAAGYCWFIETPAGAWPCFVSPTPHHIRFLTVLTARAHEPVQPPAAAAAVIDLRYPAEVNAKRLLALIDALCAAAARQHGGTQSGKSVVAAEPPKSR